jgi:hypothetical protein
VDPLEIRHKPLEAIAWRLVQQYLSEADDRADGSAEVLADMGEEGRLSRSSNDSDAAAMLGPAGAGADSSALAGAARSILPNRRGSSMGLVS